MPASGDMTLSEVQELRRLMEVDDEAAAAPCSCEIDRGCLACSVAYGTRERLRTAAVNTLPALLEIAERVLTEAEVLPDHYPCMAPLTEGEYDEDNFCGVPFGIHEKVPMLHPFCSYPERPAAKLKYAPPPRRCAGCGRDAFALRDLCSKCLYKLSQKDTTAYYDERLTTAQAVAILTTPTNPEKES